MRRQEADRPALLAAAAAAAATTTAAAAATAAATTTTAALVSTHTEVERYDTLQTLNERWGRS